MLMPSENPYQSPQSTTLRPDEATASRDRLRRIASAQRHVNIAILLYLGIIPVLGLESKSENPWVSVLLGLYLLFVVGLGATSVYRLAAIFRGYLVAVIYVIGLLVPLLGLLLLLSISGKATKELRDAGIKVGLLGASPDSI